MLQALTTMAKRKIFIKTRISPPHEKGGEKEYSSRQMIMRAAAALTPNGSAWGGCGLPELLCILISLTHSNKQWFHSMNQLSAPLDSLFSMQECVHPARQAQRKDTYVS
jgi:hypothetical protein